MNPFQNSYEARLREWRDLRINTKPLTMLDKCVVIDQWWQQVPLTAHHLHWDDTENWSDPWTLLSENTYCTLTRAIGVCYTLLMCEVDNVRLVTATDAQCEEHYLVIVNDEIVLNYWPNCVTSVTLDEFSIQREMSISKIQQKLK